MAGDHNCPIVQKGDATTLNNYRPIALANTCYKLWTSIIAFVLTEYVEANKILGPEHEGFRKHCSTSRAVCSIALLLEDAQEHRQPIYFAYLDFKGAYPSTDHTQTRQGFGAP
eukprot:scaffold90148_cov39-Prasinocladus_malaysianus.AAC.1